MTASIFQIDYALADFSTTFTPPTSKPLTSPISGCSTQKHLASRQLAQLALSTAARSGGANLRAITIALADALVLLAHLLRASTATADISRVAVVTVDANKIARHAISLDVLDDNAARTAIVGAVTTAAVQLAGIDDGEVLDGNGAATVMLDDLVLGLCGTAALDQDIAGTESGDGVFADITEPDVGQGTSTLAVDALQGVLADDDVGELSAILEDEDGAVAAGVGVAVAGPATVELLVAAVEGAADGGWLGQGDDAAGAGWDVEGLSCAEASQSAEGKGGGELHLELK